MSTDIAEAIGNIASSLEQFKADVNRRIEFAETRAARPGAGAAEFKGRDYHPDADKALQTRATPEQRQALTRWLRTGDQKAFDLAARLDTRANLTVTTGDGQAAVIPWLNPMVQTQSIENNELLRRVRRVTATNFPVKTIVSTAGGFQWVNETSSRDETDSPQPKVIEIAPGEWSAKPTITNWALQDLQFDAEAWLLAELRLTYATALMNAVTTGDGNNKPLGILAAPTDAAVTPPLGTIRRFVTGAASTLPTTAAGMLTLLQSVSGSLAWQYRDGAVWLMNNSTLQTIRAVRDLQDRPLFLDSAVQAGQNTLLGYPVVECESVPDVTAGTFPIIFGNLSMGYLLATSEGMQVTRDDITSAGFTKFYTRQRVGGKPTDTAALRVVRVSAT